MAVGDGEARESARAQVDATLGIGANAAIFSLFDQILLSSLPVREPDQLVNLAAPGPKPGSQSCNQAGDCEAVFSYAMFRDLEGKSEVLSGLGKVGRHHHIPVNPRGAESPSGKSYSG